MPKLPSMMERKTASAGLSPADPLTARARLEEAQALTRSGHVSPAQVICEELVARDPSYPGALSLLGSLHLSKRDYPRALSYLVRAQMLNPFDGATLKLLSATYVQLGAWEMAARTLREALSENPGDIEANLAFSEIMRRDQEYEIAATGYRKVLAADPASQAAEIGLAMCDMNTGMHAEAAQRFGNLLQRGERSRQLIFNAARLQAHLPGFNWLDLANEARIGKTENKNDFDIAIAFLKAEILDRAGRYDEAWRQLVAANQQTFLGMEEALKNQIAIQDASLARARGSSARAFKSGPSDIRSPVSLLILGPSRSGKTTLEALAASAGRVKRGYENPILENAVRRAYQSAGYPASRQYWSMPPQVETLCREFYLDELKRRARAAAVFTNTDPDRILEAAKFAQIVPNVRFAFLKRNPEDLTLRIFMKKYASGNAHAYDLAAIRRYISWYHQFIDILAAKFPEISLVVQYEDLIENPAKIREQVARHCGLDAIEIPLPAIEDDRGCATSYLSWMNQPEL